MRFLHLADLHIGKKVNEFSMIEDQKYILEQLIEIAKEQQVEGIMIAGDVYDKSQPTVEAVELFDQFLTKISELKKPICIISGNHDSPERLNFGKYLLEKNNLYICGVFKGSLEKISFTDEYGMIDIYMLPFVKPAMVRNYIEQEIESYDDAVRVVIENTEIDESKRNILMAHQFVIGSGNDPERSQSETISVGGVDNVGVNHFNKFDYVALGHLHAPQRISRDTVRYAGSPLKYSASEVKQHKGATIVDIGQKGDVKIEIIPLIPRLDMREIKGPINQLIEFGTADLEGNQDYIHAILTDDDDIDDALGQLRSVYPNLMSITIQNKYTEAVENNTSLKDEDLIDKSVIELFSEFYQRQNQEELTEEQVKFVNKIIEKTGGNL